MLGWHALFGTSLPNKFEQKAIFKGFFFKPSKSILMGFQYLNIYQNSYPPTFFDLANKV